MQGDEPLDSLVEARRRLAGQVLSAAARHSAIVDQLADLEAIRDERPWAARRPPATSSCAKSGSPPATSTTSPCNASAASAKAPAPKA